jgi:hypothetical protein
MIFAGLKGLIAFKTGWFDAFTERRLLPDFNIVSLTLVPDINLFLSAQCDIGFRLDINPG